MFKGKTTLSISTKVRADAQAQQTLITIDWDGYTIEQAMSDLMAGTSPRVAIQAKLRDEGVPKTLEIRACDFHAKRARVARELTSEEVMAKALTLDPEQKAKLIAELAREQGNAG